MLVTARQRNRVPLPRRREHPARDVAHLRTFRRHANELHGADGCPRLILCECGRRGCDALIRVATHELVDLHAGDDWYVVRPDHRMTGDTIVRSSGRFLVVGASG
jgi:hypothetical protein